MVSTFGQFGRLVMLEERRVSFCRHFQGGDSAPRFPRAKDDMSRQLATPAANCRLYEKENETNIGQ